MEHGHFEMRNNSARTLLNMENSGKKMITGNTCLKKHTITLR